MNADEPGSTDAAETQRRKDSQRSGSIRGFRRKGRIGREMTCEGRHFASHLAKAALRGRGHWPQRSEGSRGARWQSPNPAGCGTV